MSDKEDEATERILASKKVMPNKRDCISPSLELNQQYVTSMILKAQLKLLPQKNITGQEYHRQPLCLHRFLLAPCVTLTPPVIAWLGHLSLLRCAVCDTNSSLNNLVGTPLEAASFQLCAMRDTNSSLLSLVGAPLVTASFPLSTMRGTHSTLQCLVGTSPLKAANIDISLCAMRDTNSSSHDLICASLMVASLVLPYAFLNIRLRFFGNHLFLVYLIFTLRTGDRN
jgi:hypothetical protein